MKFGLFLVEQGIVSSDQFTEAVSRQLAGQVPLGQMAMTSGKMTKIHVFHILSIQTKTRQKFGQIALELGYLSKEQLAELLLEQDEGLPPIGEILVEMGAISQFDMETELRNYRGQLADSMDSSGVLRSVI